MPAVQLKTLLAPWLLPPFSLLLLALLGLLLALRWRRLGLATAALALLAAMALHMPLTANALAAWVEAPYFGQDASGERLPMARVRQAARLGSDHRPAEPGASSALAPSPGDAPQAIVVLGSGTLQDGADDRTAVRLTPASLERVLQGRRIARMTGLPLLVSGGVPPQGGPAEADLMARVLTQDFEQPVKWIERRSRDTLENASLSRQILAPLAIDRIVLVTNALHMRRAETIFRAAGFQVLPAPHDYASGPTVIDLGTLTPRTDAWVTSWQAIREIIGLGWLQVRPARDN